MVQTSKIPFICQCRRRHGIWRSKFRRSGVRSHRLVPSEWSFAPAGQFTSRNSVLWEYQPPPNAGFFARCTGVRGITKAAKPPTAALCAPALDDSFRVKGTLNTFTECLCSVQDIFRRLPRTVCAGQPPDNLKRACVQHSGSQTLMTAFGSYASGLWGRSRESVTFC